MQSTKIKKEIDSFKASIQNLSTEIGNASVLWSDSQYQELTLTVKEVAVQAVDVISKGEQCCKFADQFEKIAQERY